MDSGAFQAASMKEMVRMATLLRDKGDRLLNFSCKLTLTLDFLVKLNEAFDLIVENVDTSCFQVINTNNSSIEVLHDLQFLHDFVQKISGLRLWNRSKIIVSFVRLEKFRSLQYLDLHGVSVRNIKLSCMRDKLKYLICTNCNLQDLKYLLSPDEDLSPQNQENGCINVEDHWALLQEVFLSGNAVEVIGSSLLYVPKLKLLDLSHNCLTDISALSHSSGSLEWLNVSFNRLKSIPVVSNCTKLKVILINDNQLADVTGLSRMPCLEQIDLSNNVLRNHSCLAPLTNLSRIQKLQLKGNPIAFKRGHRLLTIDYLHPLVIFSGKFQLDGCVLSPLEQSIFYERESCSTANVCKSVSSGSCLNHEETTTSECQNITAGGRVKQSRSPKVVGVPVGGRGLKIREASIADEEESFLNGCKDDDQESATPPVVAVHLETKRNIETLRKNVGEENWLRGGGGQKVLNILGLPVKMAIAPTLSASTPSPSQPSVVEPSLDQVIHQSDGNVETSCDKAEEVQVGAMDEGGVISGDKAFQEEEEEDAVHLKEKEEKENGAELGVFVVQRGRGNSHSVDDLLLRVTDRLLIECNGTNGMEMARRTMSNLVGVSQEDVSGSDVCRKSIRLTFRDSYSMEVLSYFMEEEESKDLLKLIEEILEMKYSNAAASAVHLTCMKCSTTFLPRTSVGTNSSYRLGMKGDNLETEIDAVPKCPKCGSVAVVQNVAEEASNFLEPSGVSKLQDESIPSSENVAFHHSEHKDPIAQWANINFSDEVPTSSEAVDHGLHLHVLLNILPDGQGKEFDIQDVLVFHGNSGEAFCGHIVISADIVYVLKESDAHDSEERRLSVDEFSAPILVEQHPTHCCLSVVRLHSGYFLKFGPEPASSLWVFSRHPKQMEKVVEVLYAVLKDKELRLDEDQRINENAKLSEIIMLVPAAAVTCLTGICGPLESSVDDAQYGIIVLTSTVVFFVNHSEIDTFVSNSEYIPSNERRIADLVSLNGAVWKVHQLHGIILHFLSEEHDDKFMVWPWGDGTLLDFLYHLQKPWEDIFSVPFETILAQGTGEEN